MVEFPKKYETQEIEKKWQNYWDENKIYKWDSSYLREDTFVIDTPPPTVSGLLHMGHIFSYTQTDIIARYKRMSGKSVFYPIGFDDNGLPTERLVEKEKKIKGYNMPRQEFIAICKEVVKESEEEFRKLFKATALSMDFDEEYQTINDRSKTLSQMSFLDLLSKNEAYRKLEPVLWDTVDVTALSQADIEDKEFESQMNYLKFKTILGEEIIIATTRPEMISACVAVFVHPDDARYKHLLGTKVLTALFNNEVIILADDSVAIDKGTGAVMCCTFGDITDVYWWKKYNLATKIVIDKTGKMINIDSVFDGLKVIEARKLILEKLAEQNLIIKQEKITHAVKCGERSKAPIEILIADQWFIKVLDKKEQLLEKSNQCNWYPAYMKVRLESWINGLNFDWCISRQRFFGVPFPVWYSKRAGEEGKIIAADIKDLPVDPTTCTPKGYSKDEVVADFDVMDTWATSSISVQLNSHAISKDFAIDYDRHQKLYPADLRPQAHEIIRTWTFSTIVKSLLHEDSIPWKNLMISGWCLASDKTKMSKSKGNVVTPMNLIIEKGADTIRYWTATSKLGSDIAYSEDVFSNGKRLANKLWNAASFSSIHLKNVKNDIKSVKDDIEKNIIKEEMDKWILRKLYKTIEKATDEFELFEYSTARMAIEQFFWRDFCDNYLEIVKTRAYDEQNLNPQGELSAAHTIYHILKALTLLFAPIMPHITEEISNILFATDTIHKIGTWPKITDYIFTFSEEIGDDCVAILDEIRKIKAEKQISIKAPISRLYLASGKEDANNLEAIFSDLKNVINADEIIIFDKNKDFI